MTARAAITPHSLQTRIALGRSTPARRWVSADQSFSVSIAGNTALGDVTLDDLRVLSLLCDDSSRWRTVRTKPVRFVPIGASDHAVIADHLGRVLTTIGTAVHRTADETITRRFILLTEFNFIDGNLVSLRLADWLHGAIIERQAITVLSRDEPAAVMARWFRPHLYRGLPLGEGLIRHRHQR